MESRKNQPNQESVSLLIQQRVRPDCIARYEAWLPIMMARAAEQAGHQAVHLIRPPNGGTEYSIIIRYSLISNAENWVNSDSRRDLLAEISDAFEVPDQAQI